MSSKPQFSIHYSRQEARQLLPQVEEWLNRLSHLDRSLTVAGQHLDQLMAQGHDRGGRIVEEYFGLQGDCAEILREFQKRQILIKDLQRGLVDFPSILGGREVFLCWERGEADVEFWHELDGGYGGRERLD